MIPKKERVTRLDYCQYLLVSQINYTLTNYAEHTEKFIHDMANRYLSGDEIRPRLVWENIKSEVRLTPYGFLVFDDTVIDKNFSHPEHKVKVFRVVLSTQRTDYVVTNEMPQDNVGVVRDVCGFRWKVEEFHRETKQLTGIEGNQCRRAVRNHIGCAILVWVRLKQVAVETHRTIYRVKHELLDDYLRQQLKSSVV